jgi:hypothetical protein
MGSFTSTIVYLEELPIPICYESGWAPELVWMQWRREKSLPKIVARGCSPVIWVSITHRYR